MIANKTISKQTLLTELAYMKFLKGGLIWGKAKVD